MREEKSRSAKNITEVEMFSFLFERFEIVYET